MSELPPSRAHIATERSNPRTAHIDRAPTMEALALLFAEDAEALRAVSDARESIAAAVELVRERLARGGRLFYAGAGTSGRLATLDAAELPPTFGSDPAQVQAIVAGGTNEKLRDRGIRLVAELCALSREAAAELFERAGREVKLAVLMHRRSIAAQEAQRELERAGGSLRRALGE